MAKTKKRYTVCDHPLFDQVAEFDETDFLQQFPDLYKLMTKNSLSTLVQERTYNPEGDSATIAIYIKEEELEACQRCGAVAIVQVTGKTSDGCFMRHLHREYDGYVLRGMGVGQDDYLEFEFCVKCGQIQGEFPKKIHGRIVTRETEGYPYG